MIRLKAFVLTALLLFGLAGGERAYSQVFQSLGSASLSVTSSSGRVALPAGSFGNNVTIQNIGDNEAFVIFGTSAVVSTTAAESVPAGSARCFSSPSTTYVAAITASSTTTLRISQGNGSCSISFRRGNGGTPGGAAGGSLSGTYPNPSLAAVNSIATSLAIGGATIGTDALAWTGTATGSGALTAGAFIPSGSTAPTNGMYLGAANQLNFATNSSVRFTLSSAGTLSGASSAAYSLINSNASATVPTLVPRQTGSTTGIGANAVGEISLIAAALERVRVATGAASVSDILLPGTLFTGGTGTTTFPQIFVQPTGTSAVTTWSTSGTILGANVVSGFAGNFLDFHVAGGASAFSVSASGSIIAAGVIRGSASGSQIQLQNGSTILSSVTAASWQLGAADAAAPVAQTLRAQSVVAGTSNANGANFTKIASLSTGSGTSGDHIWQIGVAPGGGSPTVQATATTAAIIKGETGQFRLPLIASDAALTDTTVCQDTTNHGLFSGSGALGVCLGTSGRQFKTDFAPMTAGIDEIMKINLWNYRYKPGYGDNGVRMQYGPTAQDVEAVLPDLAGHDAKGETINYDWGAFIPIMMRAIQQQQAQIAELKRAR